MYIRRIFYDTATGAMLDAYSARGNFVLIPQESDAQARGLTGWSCLEWRQPDAEIDRMFAERRTLTVDVETHALIWGEPGSADPDEPEPPAPDDGDVEAQLADAVAALTMLGYTEGGEVDG